jgi:hypothetical protein
MTRPTLDEMYYDFNEGAGASSAKPAGRFRGILSLL